MIYMSSQTMRKLSKMKARVTIDELIGDDIRARGVELDIGRIIGTWEEEPGPTRMPGIGDLREWDHRLLKKYPRILPPVLRPLLSSAQWENVIFRVESGVHAGSIWQHSSPVLCSSRQQSAPQPIQVMHATSLNT